MSSVSVSPATESEVPAALALIERAFEPGLELLVVRREGELAGAAGVSWRNARKLEGFGLTVGVRPSHRRQGVGRALAAAAAGLASGEAAGLWSQTPVEEGSAAALFAQACGYEARLRDHYFCADRAGVDKVAPVIEWFLARQNVPDTARVIPLSQATLEEVAWVMSAEFGDGPGTALARLNHDVGTGAIDLDKSAAVMDDEELAGFMLAALRDGVFTTDLVVVAPKWRGGWANMLLIDAMLAHRDQAQALRFHCTDEAQFTLKIAQRLQAVRERVTAYYFRPV